MATQAVAHIVEREAHVFRRLWRGSAFTQFATPVLYLLAIGVGLGGLVDQRSGPVAGVSYLDFVVPGLMAAGAVQSAAADSLWPVLSGMKWQGFYLGVVSTPATPFDIYLGRVVWIGCRVTMSGSVFLLVAAVLGGVASPWAPLAVPAVVLGALALAAPLVAFAATQQDDLAFPMIMRLGVVPMFLFSGTFFPVSQLPGWLQPLVGFSPLWHAVELARDATTGRAGWWVPGHVAVLLAVIGLGVWWGRHSFTRRLTP